jgi:hypothetical protein
MAQQQRLKTLLTMAEQNSSSGSTSPAASWFLKRSLIK